MSNPNDEQTNGTETVSNGADTSDVTVSTKDNGENVAVFVDDGTGSAPADFNLTVERYSEAEDRWMFFTTEDAASNTNPQKFEYTGVPNQMRVRATNDSGVSNDYRINVVSY